MFVFGCCRILREAPVQLFLEMIFALDEECRAEISECKSLDTAQKKACSKQSEINECILEKTMAGFENGISSAPFPEVHENGCGLRFLSV